MTAVAPLGQHQAFVSTAGCHGILATASAEISLERILASSGLSERKHLWLKAVVARFDVQDPLSADLLQGQWLITQGACVYWYAISFCTPTDQQGHAL